MSCFTFFVCLYLVTPLYIVVWLKQSRIHQQEQHQFILIWFCSITHTHTHFTFLSSPHTPSPSSSSRPHYPSIFFPHGGGANCYYHCLIFLPNSSWIMMMMNREPTTIIIVSLFHSPEEALLWCHKHGDPLHHHAQQWSSPLPPPQTTLAHTQHTHTLFNESPPCHARLTTPHTSRAFIPPPLSLVWGSIHGPRARNPSLPPFHHTTLRGSNHLSQHHFPPQPFLTPTFPSLLWACFSHDPLLKITQKWAKNVCGG